MAAYATVEEVAAGFRELDEDEQARAAQLLLEAAVLIDATNTTANADTKAVVSCRMVRRALNDAESPFQVPMGSTQGSQAAGGYSQSWTISGGAAGELYLGKTERSLLGLSNQIGARSPLEGPVCPESGGCT